jgi:hypothetical protein
MVGRGPAGQAGHSWQKVLRAWRQVPVKRRYGVGWGGATPAIPIGRGALQLLAVFAGGLELRQRQPAIQLICRKIEKSLGLSEDLSDLVLGARHTEDFRRRQPPREQALFDAGRRCVRARELTARAIGGLVLFDRGGSDLTKQRLECAPGMLPNFAVWMVRWLHCRRHNAYAQCYVIVLVPAPPNNSRYRNQQHMSIIW